MRCTVAVFLVLLATFPALTQEAKDKEAKDKEGKDKGGALAPGQNLPGPFHPYNVNGPSKARFHCLVSEYGNDPTVLLFARGLTDNDAFKDLLKKLDAAITRNPTTRLRCFVVFLSDDLPKPLEEDDKREEEARKLEKFGEGLDLKNVVLCLGSKADADKYHLDAANALTVILYRKLLIVASQAVPADKVDETLVKGVLASVADKFGATR